MIDWLIDNLLQGKSTFNIDISFTSTGAALSSSLKIDSSFKGATFVFEVNICAYQPTWIL